MASIVHPFPDPVFDVAREFANRKLYQFSQVELSALRPFFTNPDRSVFLMHTLPTTVGTALLAMYSRLKNPRGLRGVFVDNFLPQFLAVGLPEVASDFGGDVTAFCTARKITSLETFLASSHGAGEAFEGFLDSLSVDPDYLRVFGGTEKVQKFLAMFLDKYGHNSIARMGSMWIGFEQISILAAKSIEWTRPGSGFIELSTRYVDMKGKDCYPIARLLAAYGMPEDFTNEIIERSFESYQRLQGDNFSGPFPMFLRESHGHHYQNDLKGLEAGVIGETCDVLGNFLPAATLTSVGVSTSGESLPGLIQHLMLDATPENISLVEALRVECSALGLDQFIRHIDPTAWKGKFWNYLSTRPFQDQRDKVAFLFPPLVRTSVEAGLLSTFQSVKGMWHLSTFDDVLAEFTNVERGKFDKLPNQFENFSASFYGTMSFRGWRDLQRMGFCSHFRTLLTPNLGFYRYDKPAPTMLHQAMAKLHSRNSDLYAKMSSQGIPPELRQYPLALGNNVGFQVGANLLQWEFCAFQRTDWSVNHEVRLIFMAIDNLLRQAYPWWSQISRGDTTPAYVFARGNEPIPLISEALASSPR